MGKSQPHYPSSYFCDPQIYKISLEFSVPHKTCTPYCQRIWKQGHVWAKYLVDCGEHGFHSQRSRFQLALAAGRLQSRNPGNLCDRAPHISLKGQISTFCDLLSMSLSKIFWSDRTIIKGQLTTVKSRLVVVTIDDANHSLIQEILSCTDDEWLDTDMILAIDRQLHLLLGN